MTPSPARAVALVYARELRETLRDRRTLAVMVLFPLVVYPLLSLITVQLAQTRATGLQARKSVVAAPPASTELGRQVRDALATEKQVTIVEDPADDAGELAAGRVDAVVRVDADGKPAPHGSTRLVVRYDSTKDESRLGSDRAEDALARALPPGCTARFDVVSRDVARPERRGGYVASRALPLVLVLMVMVGAFYPAIDSTAGERERGTIETTLVLPLPRAALLAGKVLAVATLATIAGLLNLGSMALTLLQATQIAKPAMTAPLPWRQLALAATVTIPAAAFFASIMIAVGAAARGFKEAQNLMTPLHVLLSAPALVGALGELRLGPLTALIPSLGLTLLARDLVLGVAQPLGAACALGATIVWTAVGVSFASRMFEPERLLAVATGRRRGRATAREAGPAVNAGEAAALFAIGFVLLVAAAPLQARDLVTGLLASQWIGMFGLVVAFARWKRRPVADVLQVGRPTPLAFAGAALMGGSAWIVVALVSQALAPPPKELIDQLRHTFSDRPLGLNLLLVAVTPAICEEALFRGAILRGLLTRFSRTGAIALCGFLFCVYHVNLYRLLPTALLGVMLSWIAVASGSVLPGMLAHAINNGILVTLANAAQDETLEKMTPRGQWLLGLAAALVLCAGAWVLRRGNAKRQEL